MTWLEQLLTWSLNAALLPHESASAEFWVGVGEHIEVIVNIVEVVDNLVLDDVVLDDVLDDELDGKIPTF